MSTVELATVVPYFFTKEDHDAADNEMFVKQINSFKQPDQQEWGRYDFRDGIYGEIAMAKWLGIDRSPHELDVLHDGGYDFADYHNGEVTTIDVKATAARGTWNSAHLMRQKRSGLRADVYVLVVMTPDRQQARFAGWATKAELAAAKIKTKNDTSRPTVYVPTRVIHESDLHHDWRGWV